MWQHFMIEFVKSSLKLYLCHYGNWVQMTSPGPEAGKQCEVVSDFSFCLISVFMVDRGRNWGEGWDCRAEQRPSVIERGVYVQLELFRFVLYKDWPLYEGGIRAGQQWRKTDPLACLTQAVLFITRSMERFKAEASILLAPALKYPLCTLRFLENVSHVNFILHTYPSICKSFKMYACVKPICFESVWKTLAENTDKILMVKINTIAHSYTMFYWTCHAISLKPGHLKMITLSWNCFAIASTKWMLVEYSLHLYIVTLLSIVLNFIYVLPGSRRNLMHWLTNPAFHNVPDPWLSFSSPCSLS